MLRPAMIRLRRRLLGANRLARGTRRRCAGARRPCAAAERSRPTTSAIRRDLHRPRQDHRADHLLRGRDGRDRAIRHAADHRAGLLHPPGDRSPADDRFVEVDEVTPQNEYKRIFSGWMFAASPGLHGIEQPVYDIWLTDCKGAGETVATTPEPGAAEPATPPPPQNASPTPKKPGKLRRVQPQTPKPPVDDFGEDAAAAKSRFPNPAPQSTGPVEVGPPPGFAAPRPRRPATDPDALFPPSDIPNGRSLQASAPGNGF